MCWILPNNHKLSSHFVQGYVASIEDLKELSNHYTGLNQPLPFTWKTKCSVLQTWLRAWKRVYWIPHLFGRMLKPSMENLFVEKYTASLEVIHVPHSQQPANEKESMMSDTYGLILKELSKQQTLFGASSKTSMITLPSDMKLSKKAY